MPLVDRSCSFATYADEEVTLDGDVIEMVAKLSYLADILSFGGGVQKAFNT